VIDRTATPLRRAASARASSWASTSAIIAKITAAYQRAPTVMLQTPPNRMFCPERQQARRILPAQLAGHALRQIAADGAQRAGRASPGKVEVVPLVTVRLDSPHEEACRTHLPAVAVLAVFR
jgi:hypothetical protein